MTASVMCIGAEGRHMPMHNIGAVMADALLKDTRNCHRNRYNIVWAHGRVFPVNLWKKSGDISLRICRYMGNHIDSKHMHL